MSDTNMEKDDRYVIHKSPTASNKKVSKATLLKSTRMHISDVMVGLSVLKTEIDKSIAFHDHDKISYIDDFYRFYSDGCKDPEWMESHYELNRHHLGAGGVVPHDVDLIDVLEYIVDCVVAGLTRSGEVYRVEISDDVLQAAFDNTVTLLKKRLVVE